MGHLDVLVDDLDDQGMVQVGDVFNHLFQMANHLGALQEVEVAEQVLDLLQGHIQCQGVVAALEDRPDPPAADCVVTGVLGIVLAAAGHRVRLFLGLPHGTRSGLFLGEALFFAHFDQFLAVVNLIAEVLGQLGQELG
jgi:hypothetical protein